MPDGCKAMADFKAQWHGASPIVRDENGAK